MSTPRIYLTGRVQLERGDRLLGERDLPGRQGRIAFAYLAAHRRRSVSRAELIDAIWAGEPPVDVETSLSAILSKLRRSLRMLGWTPAEAAIETQSGTVTLTLPPDIWIDVEEVAHVTDQAEGALRSGDHAGAWSCANVIVSIARRPFLPDVPAPWAEAYRSDLAALLARGLHCLAVTSEAAGQATLAVQYVCEIITREPFRETAYQHLMRLHAAMGNRAEALRVFDRCRTLLRDELGTSPSPQTESVFLEILRAGEQERV